MQFVVAGAGQAPITLECKKYLGKNKTSKIIVHGITEAHLHLRQNVTRKVRARTYQIHAVRFTSRHRNREDHILLSKNRQDENTNSTSKNRNQNRKITNPKGKRENKKFKSGKEAIESKQSRRETHKRMRNFSQIAGSTYS